MKTTEFLNIKILNIGKDDLLKKLDKGVVYTPNLDHLFNLQKNQEFYQAYKKAEWVICDSKILFLLSKLLKDPLPMAIPGSSFFTSFYQYHKDDPNCRIFLLGAAEGVAEKAKNEINNTVGHNIVVGALSPSYGFEKNISECDEIIEIINKSGANVLLVGVGSPKQELWISKYRDKMPGVDLFLALGATIDFEAKTLKRAPKLWQNLGMEWLYRVIKEPRRLFRRYFINDIQFFYHFSKQLIGTYRNPFEDVDPTSSK